MTPENEDQIEKLRRLARESGLFPELLGDDAIADALNSNRPKIKLPGEKRLLSDFAREIGEHVKAKGIYRRDRTPVVVLDGALIVVTAEFLRTWVESHLICFKDKSVKLSAGETAAVAIVNTMNLDTARGTLEAVQFWRQLPEIKRVNQTRLPVVRRDGTLELLRPGYFEEQGIYTMDDGLELDETMTRDEARAALDDLWSEFPFPDDEGRSKAVAIAAMLTMFCASMLPRRANRPGFIYTANSPGAGKTLAAKIPIIAVVGSATTRTLPRKEEAKKVLDVIAMGASSYALFDNIRGKIAGEEIEAFITAAEWEGRVLGSSEAFRVDNVATVFLTGNQTTTSTDMSERCLFVELFVQEADNRDRKIKHVIDDSWLAAPLQRSKMLSAMWALVRGWEADGKPAGPTAMPRFHEWSSIVAGIVHAAGYGDPVAKPDGVRENEELSDMRELVEALAGDELGSREPWKFDQVIERVKDLGLFEDSDVRSRSAKDLFDADGRVTPAGRSTFGNLFTRYDRRVFSIEGKAYRFIVEGKGNSRRYIVER